MRQRVERRDRERPTQCTHRRRRRRRRPRREACFPILILPPPWVCDKQLLPSVRLESVRPTLPRETHLPPQPPPVARSAQAQPSFFASAFTVHRYLLLSFPSKPNKMFVTLWSENLRFIESRNCACVVRTWLVVFQFSCLSFLCFSACVVNCDELCLSVRLLPVGFFFFFCLAFWLCDSVTQSMFVTSLYR